MFCPNYQVCYQKMLESKRRMLQCLGPVKSWKFRSICFMSFHNPWQIDVILLSGESTITTRSSYDELTDGLMCPSSMGMYHHVSYIYIYIHMCI